MLQITPAFTVPSEALEFHTTRASGPGGQHVNTTDSAVQLRFDAKTTLQADVFTRLRVLAGSRMTKDGVLILDAANHRSQARNRQDAADRLVDLLREALARPKTRVATQPSRAAKRRRLDTKRQRGETKALRKTPSRND